MEETSGRAERRTLPRFPLSFLLFRDHSARTFAVRDVSYGGMRLGGEDAACPFRVGDEIAGALRLKGRILDVRGRVKWVEGGECGVGFASGGGFGEGIRSFLGVDAAIEGMKVLHDDGAALAPRLKYWLRSDGVVEIFVWEGGSFQIIFCGDFVEGSPEGLLRTGRLAYLGKDMAVADGEEFLFRFDSPADSKKVGFASDVLGRMGERHLPHDVLEFLRTKTASG